MGCGCKQKNQNPPPPPQPAQPATQTSTQNGSSLQEAVKKTILKYYKVDKSGN